VDLTFIGTATCLIRYGDLTLLTDPNFLHRGQRASLGYGLWSRRLTQPALDVAELPSLDAVVLSHLHGDHFDRVARRGLDRSVPVLTTRHAAWVLRRWGFGAAHGMRTWAQQDLGSPAGTAVRVTSLPAVHAHGPLRPLLPPVMGSLLEFTRAGVVELRVYVTGDTLLGGHLDAIARRWPQIDVAVVHLGGTRVLGALVTLDASGGVGLLRRMRPGAAVPVHYDDYGVFKSPLTEFRAAVERTPLATAVRYVDRGDTVQLRRGGQ